MTLQNDNHAFVKKLAPINPEFYSALHFCKLHYREPIAALIGLHEGWLKTARTLKEPIALQIRLRWWYEQWDLYYGNEKTLPVNTPPEMEVLRAYDLRPLITAFEDDYILSDYDNNNTSHRQIMQVIDKIMDYQGFNKAFSDYGYYYGCLKNDTNNTEMPHYKLPFGLRFIRIPIILNQKQSTFMLVWRLIKNMIFA
ncbi:MAG: hypothetical protein ACJAQ0_001501 [Dasania sp.]|jgi:hypothetical protein